MTHPVTPAAPAGVPTHGVVVIEDLAGFARVIDTSGGQFFVPSCILRPIPSPSPDPLVEARAKVARQLLIDDQITGCSGCGGRDFPKRLDCSECTAWVDERILAAERALAEPVDSVREFAAAADALITATSKAVSAEIRFERDASMYASVNQARRECSAARIRYAAAKAAMEGPKA